MDESVQPGGVSSRVRWLIGSACAVTVLLAAEGMQALWECIEWVRRSWGVQHPEDGAFWYRHGIALALTAAIAIAWLPPFRVSRLLRLAVAIPILHLGAIIAAGQIWSVFDGNGLAMLEHMRWTPEYMSYVDVTVPSASTIALAFAAMIVVGIAIKPRHGEWAHATVMLALSYLLLLGLWLPVVAKLAVQKVHSGHHYWTYTERVMSSDTVAWLAAVPAASLALAFVVIVFRSPRAFAAWRHVLRPATVMGLVLAMLVAVTLHDKSWLVYLESSYLVMSAVVLAVASLVMLTAVTWLRSLLAHRRARDVTYHDGVIADDDHTEIARYEVTSWLRGPRLVVRPFVVTTAQGNVPIAGAQLLVPVPVSSTALDVGGQVAVLSVGTRVSIATRTARADGHPFRATEIADVVRVATPNARAFRFSDVVLVVWRPAVAYLAILLAVAAPYLTIFLTD